MYPLITEANKLSHSIKQSSVCLLSQEAPWHARNERLITVPCSGTCRPLVCYKLIDVSEERISFVFKDERLD
jgi:hypothetical protein